MQFIIDNYVWFLIAGIVIVMTIIGYIAEKTDFGHKEIKKAEKKEKKVAKDVKKLKKQNLKLGDVVYNDNNKEKIEVIDVDQVKEEDIFAFNDLNDTNKDSISVSGNEANTTPSDSIQSDKIETIEEDLTVPLNDKKQDSVVVEDLSVPLSGEIEKPLEEIEEDLTVPLNEVSSENIPVEETKKEEKDVKNTDDIWKF